MAWAGGVAYKKKKGFPDERRSFSLNSESVTLGVSVTPGQTVHRTPGMCAF